VEADQVGVGNAVVVEKKKDVAPGQADADVAGVRKPALRDAVIAHAGGRRRVGLHPRVRRRRLVDHHDFEGGDRLMLQVAEQIVDRFGAIHRRKEDGYARGLHRFVQASA
jgi:hypothetical protein